MVVYLAAGGEEGGLAIVSLLQIASSIRLWPWQVLDHDFRIWVICGCQCRGHCALLTAFLKNHTWIVLRLSSMGSQSTLQYSLMSSSTGTGIQRCCTPPFTASTASTCNPSVLLPFILSTLVPISVNILVPISLRLSSSEKLTHGFVPCLNEGVLYGEVAIQ